MKSSIANEPLLGAHVSAAGGVSTVFERADILGINTFQLFVKNNKQWFVAPLDNEEILRFKTLRKSWNKGPIVAHACYLLNLGSKVPEIMAKSEKSFIEELKRADAIGVDYFVFHPGVHSGQGEEQGVKNVIAALDEIHRQTPEVKTKTVIEITAGQGSSIGSSFNQLERILSGVKDKKRVAVCLDTCHMFAAGYDIRTEDVWEKTFEEFEARVGFKNLVCVHTNDSKKGLGSRVDRHEHIGKGEIGLSGFRLLMNDPRFQNIPKILETPKDEKMTEDFQNLALLRSLVGSAKSAKPTSMNGKPTAKPKRATQSMEKPSKPKKARAKPAK